MGCAMKSKVLEGSAREITEAIVRLNGRIVRAVVYFDEPQPLATSVQTALPDEWEQDLDAIMATAPRNQQPADVSREAMYSPEKS